MKMGEVSSILITLRYAWWREAALVSSYDMVQVTGSHEVSTDRTSRTETVEVGNAVSRQVARRGIESAMARRFVLATAEFI
jgi:hypothetical protein